jgi:hypothetical protein
MQPVLRRQALVEVVMEECRLCFRKGEEFAGLKSLLTESLYPSK